MQLSRFSTSAAAVPTEERLTHRNGYRPRRWDARAGELELAIAKLRRGNYFPSFLQPRRRSEQAPVSVVQQAYVSGVSSRRVDQLVDSLAPLLEERRDQKKRRCSNSPPPEPPAMPTSYTTPGDLTTAKGLWSSVG